MLSDVPFELLKPAIVRTQESLPLADDTELRLVEVEGDHVLACGNSLETTERTESKYAGEHARRIAR